MVAAGAALVLAIGVAIPIILAIPPFIAGLCGLSLRVVYIYLAILTALFVFFDIWNVIDNLHYGDVPLTARLVSTLFMTIGMCLIELVISIITHSCGRELRVLTLRMVGRFRPS